VFTVCKFPEIELQKNCRDSLQSGREGSSKPFRYNRQITQLNFIYEHLYDKIPIAIYGNFVMLLFINVRHLKTAAEACCSEPETPATGCFKAYNCFKKI